MTVLPMLGLGFSTGLPDRLLEIVDDLNVHSNFLFLLAPYDL
jgi:hypothetical protein